MIASCQRVRRGRQGTLFHTRGTVLLRICPVLYGGYQGRVLQILQGFTQSKETDQVYTIKNKREENKHMNKKISIHYLYYRG